MLTKFQFHCSITCRDILYFVFWLPYCHTFWRHQYLICIIQKSWISLERNEIWQKGKHHSSSLLKAFQIRLLFNTPIFHFIGTLTSRKQFVNVNKCKSSQRLLERGVPQGSVLGPLLYLLYTSPLADIIKRYKLEYHFYADDTQLYVAFKTDCLDKMEECKTTIEQCVRDIDNWMVINKSN